MKRCPIQPGKVTKVAFQGARIPRYQECIETAFAAHKWLPGVQSVGWDLVPSLDGVQLLEGNDDWGATIAMWVLPGFADTFLEWRERAIRNRFGSDV